jgi:voltage-gated potassium channel
MISKRRIYEIINMTDENDLFSRIIIKFLIILILLNALAVVLESVPAYSHTYGAYFQVFDYFSVAVFTVEYLLRLWTCNLEQKYNSHLRGRLRFMLKPMSLIDLIAILPFFLPLFFAFDLRFVRILRTIRMIRILKLGRYFEVIQKLGRVFIAKREELVFSLGIVMLVLVISSSLMYYVENQVQPDAFSSIPAAMWWGVWLH